MVLRFACPSFGWYIGIQKNSVHVLQEYLEDKTYLDNYIILDFGQRIQIM